MVLCNCTETMAAPLRLALASALHTAMETFTGIQSKCFSTQPKGTPMAGWYELNTNDKGQYSFVLKAGNAEVILRSEQYESKASAENGIASVQKNSPLEANYERKDASDGRPYFNLKAANHQVIGTSQMYKSAAARDGGIESVKTNGPSTTVKTAA